MGAPPERAQLALTLWLLDTGPVVAFIDRTDRAHASVSDRLSTFTGQLVTTGAVITEAMHLLSDSREGPIILAEFLVSTHTRIMDWGEPSLVRTAARLMAKYADTPMDYADATLVLTGEALDIFDVLTLDRRGFSTYRTASRRSFRIVRLD